MIYSAARHVKINYRHSLAFIAIDKGYDYET